MYKAHLLVIALLVLSSLCFVGAVVEHKVLKGDRISPGPGGTYGIGPSSNNKLQSFRYYFSVTEVTEYSPSNASDSSLKLSTHLGPSALIGTPLSWSNTSIQSDWTSIKQFTAVDPCVATVNSEQAMYLFADVFNMSLVADVIVASSELITLKPNQTSYSDISWCFGEVSEIQGYPKTCDQYFLFDFSSTAPRPEGYSWRFTISSTKSNPIPFVKAIIAANISCPDTRPTGEDSTSWYEMLVDPLAPGNSPTKITLSGLSIGTQYKKWWIKLSLPSNYKSEEPFLFAIQAQVDPPRPPPTSVPMHEPQSNPKSPQVGNKRPIPVWVIALVSVGSAFIGIAALIWVYRMVKKDDKREQSYEIY